MGFFKSLMSVISTDGKTGTPFRLNNNQTVYYKGNGVTKVDAAHVAGYFNGYHSIMDLVVKIPIYDVQLLAATVNDPVQLGFIVGNANVSDETISYFKESAESLQEAFPGRSIIIALLDTNFKTVSVL